MVGDDDLMLELGMNLAEINNVEVKINDERIFAIIVINGTRKASTVPVNIRETNVGAAVYEAVCGAIKHKREELIKSMTKPA